MVLLQQSIQIRHGLVSEFFKQIDQFPPPTFSEDVLRFFSHHRARARGCTCSWCDLCERWSVLIFVAEFGVFILVVSMLLNTWLLTFLNRGHSYTLGVFEEHERFELYSHRIREARAGQCSHRRRSTPHTSFFYFSLPALRRQLPLAPEQPGKVPIVEDARC